MDDNLSGYWHDNSVECGIKNAVTLQCCGLSTHTRTVEPLLTDIPDLANQDSLSIPASHNILPLN